MLYKQQPEYRQVTYSSEWNYLLTHIFMKHIKQDNVYNRPKDKLFNKNFMIIITSTKNILIWTHFLIKGVGGG